MIIKMNFYHQLKANSVCKTLIHTTGPLFSPPFHYPCPCPRTQSSLPLSQSADPIHSTSKVKQVSTSNTSNFSHPKHPDPTPRTQEKHSKKRRGEKRGGQCQSLPHANQPPPPTIHTRKQPKGQKMVIPSIQARRASTHKAGKTRQAEPPPALPFHPSF